MERFEDYENLRRMLKLYRTFGKYSNYLLEVCYTVLEIFSTEMIPESKTFESVIRYILLAALVILNEYYFKYQVFPQIFCKACETFTNVLNLWETFGV